MEYLSYVFYIQIHYIAGGGDTEEARVVQQGARESRAVQQGAVSGFVGLCRSVGTSSTNVLCTACGRLARAPDRGVQKHCDDCLESFHFWRHHVHFYRNRSSHFRRSIHRLRHVAARKERGQVEVMAIASAMLGVTLRSPCIDTQNTTSVLSFGSRSSVGSSIRHLYDRHTKFIFMDIKNWFSIGRLNKRQSDWIRQHRLRLHRLSEEHDDNEDEELQEEEEKLPVD